MTKSLSCLIVDDEKDITELLTLSLSRMDIDTYCAHSLSEALTLLDQQTFDLCLTDMNMPGGSGLELVEHIQTHKTNLPIAVITAHASAENAVSALKAGAFDYLSKPISLKQLKSVIAFALKQNHASPQAESPMQMIGDSAEIQQVKSLVTKLGRSQAPVYISGESGTGKELAAKCIHHQSARAEGPFIAVNCGAIPENLMESELFGHKKGAFTGAYQDKTGLFQAANGGTLFLDEVADLPLAMQVKLLRVIQEKKVRMVGESSEVTIDVRIISATHKDLSTMMDQGLFRQDLYYRLNVIQLSMPSLRARIEDVPLLAKHLITLLADKLQLAEMPSIANNAMQALMRYDFPGNVRELENLLERTLALCDNNIITEDDLWFSENNSNTNLNSQTKVSANKTDLPLPEYLEQIEKQAIVQALEKTRFNKTAAAKALGVSFRTLRYKLDKLGINQDLHPE